MTAEIALSQVLGEDGVFLKQLLWGYERMAVSAAVDAFQGRKVLLMRLDFWAEDVLVPLQGFLNIRGVHLFENHNVDAYLSSQVD